MTTRGRKAHLDKPTEWKVSIPSSLAVQVEILLTNPVTGTTRYGSRSLLIQELLQNWISTKARTSNNGNASDA